MADTAFVVASIAGLVALASTAANVVNGRAIERIKAENEAARLASEDKKQVSIYSEALARAAFDLQSRFFNIIRGDFFIFYMEGSERERNYAIENTIFVIAQFLCWVELTRQGINFIQLGNERDTKSLLRKQDEIYALWGTDRWAKTFRLFAGEQRALGEALIIGEPEFPTCMGYGRYLEELPRGTNRFVDYIRDEIMELPAGLDEARDRLTAIQHLLIEIVDLLDPDQLRFPAGRRAKA